MEPNWHKEFDAAITVCSPEGTILSMNDKSVKTFEKDGGAGLIGKNLFDCHPGDSALKLKKLMTGRKTNCYTIEKNGVKKLIFQSPWFDKMVYKGFVEISIELPPDMPHFIRE